MKAPPIVTLENCIVRPVGESLSASLFKKPLNLTINQNERWAVTGPRKRDLLSVLAAKHIPNPPLSRTYPFLDKNAWPSQAIQLVEFKGSVLASHLSARYEHFRDEFDIPLMEYLGQSLGNVKGPEKEHIDDILKKFKLDSLADQWVVGLSNGQMRRARLAKAILKYPRLLLIDEPYLGLDPSTRQTLSDILETLPPNPHVILGLRIQDKFPSWITHVAITDRDGVDKSGPIEEVGDYLEFLKRKDMELAASLAQARKNFSEKKKKESSSKDKSNTEIIRLDKVSISYRGKLILDEIEWKVAKGEKWHLRGDNGAGKSTLVSLLTADHPQSWNSKIVINGEPRKTGKHNYFDINNAIGHSSPEIHAIYPLKQTVFEAISTGYIVGSTIPPKKNELTSEQIENIERLIDQFQLAPDQRLRDLSLSDQKTVLFLRSIVKRPDILILDEAFSAMDDWRIEQCKDFINNEFQEGTVIAIGHIDNEIPDCDKYIRLIPNAGKPIIGEIEK